jgi:hypothetical protein
MKRLIMLLVLPLLGSCTTDADYYRNDYRRMPPSAHLEAPTYHSSHQYRHHRDVAPGNSRVDRAVSVHGDNPTNAYTHGKNTHTQDYADSRGNRNHGHD